MTRPAWVPENIDTAIPSAARVYDFLLGGAHNFAADRAVGEKVLEVLPIGRQVAQSNRAFLRRAVLYMIEQGVTQFLDLGSGIPTAGNVHEIAQQHDPSCRVVYVDYDEVAVAHSELILQGNDNATVVAADFGDPRRVLGATKATGLLDFSKPVGLLIVAVCHFVPDAAKPAELVAAYRSAMPSGSLLALSHLTADNFPDEMAGVVDAMANSRDPMYFRSYDEILPLFEGTELVEPGLVPAPLWHPDRDYGPDAPRDVYVGVARVP